MAIKTSKQIKEKFLSIIEYKPSDKHQITNFDNKIILENVEFEIGDFSLKDINLEFCKGKKYAIIGEYGPGKSILVKIIIRTTKTKNGEIFYDENNIKHIDINKI